MATLLFTRTMARVEDGYGRWSYRCMACVRALLTPEQFARFHAGLGVTVGTGMERATWVLVQRRVPCLTCQG